MSDYSSLIPVRDNVHDTLGVRTVEVSPEKVVLEVDVTPAVHQAFGMLHGGVSALLAEGAASIGGLVSVAPQQICVGTELNISHLRPLRTGVLRATATPIRKGRTVQVWAIVLSDERSREIAVARCTLQVVDAPSVS